MHILQVSTPTPNTTGLHWVLHMGTPHGLRVLVDAAPRVGWWDSDGDIYSWNSWIPYFTRWYSWITVVRMGNIYISSTYVFLMLFLFFVFLVNFWSLAHKSLVSPTTNHLHWPPRPLAPWESSHHYCGATVDLWNRTHPGNGHFQDAYRDILNIMGDHGRYSNGIYWYIQYTVVSKAL